MTDPDMQQPSGVACWLMFQRFAALRMDIMQCSIGTTMQQRGEFAAELDGLRDRLVLAMGDPLGITTAAPMRVAGGAARD